MSRANVLLHLSGSIACFKACALADLLVKADYAVQTTASSAALRFVGAATLEGLTGRPVLTDCFGGEPSFIPHITLAQRWADLIIAYPASADLLNRMAAGLCDDLFGAICLANNFRKPLLVAPAMNSEMFDHPSVRRSIETLGEWGVRILPTGEGRLACGSLGKGRLIEPDVAMAAIEESLCASS